LKILITNFHYGRGGGHDTYILAIARALAAQHQIFVAAPGSSRLFERASALSGVTALPMEFPAKIKDLSKMRAAYHALRALLKRERFDVVHVNGSPDHRLLLMVMLFWKGPRPRIVLTKHNSIEIKQDFLTKLRASRATDEVIAVSDSTGDLMRGSVYGKCQVTVIKNGIDTTTLYAPFDADKAARLRLAMLGADGAARLVVGTVTGFDWYKGTMDMIAAVAALPAAVREQIMVVVVGVEPNAEQVRIIEELGMRDRVHVAGFADNVPDFIATFDVGFVLSYAIETVSFACREMMAMEKPVIVSRYAGLPENIDDGVDGWIVEPRDVAGIGATLQRILADRGRLSEIARGARERAVREFSSERFIADTESVYGRGGEARLTASRRAI
jgi:L-malate glycosyltransferase